MKYQYQILTENVLNEYEQRIYTDGILEAEKLFDSANGKYTIGFTGYLYYGIVRHKEAPPLPQLATEGFMIDCI